MSVTISKKYLKREEKTHFYPTYIIAPPVCVPELEGYVLKILQDYVIVEDKTITLSRGNEWSKKEQKIFYTFEKEVKEKGRAFKRYRYTEEEVLLLYRKSEHKNFEETLEKRKKITVAGPGSLVRLSFSVYCGKYKFEQRTGWYMVSNMDAKWAYPLDYDPLRDIGKHDRQAKGCTLLEEYPVQDIAILRTNAKELERLTYLLDQCRSLTVRTMGEETLADYLVKETVSLIPRECTATEELTRELYSATHIIEDACNIHINRYKKNKVASIAEEIKELVGININQGI